MSDSAHPVRKVQQHLRRAGTLLAEQQFDAATAEVDAALAIDPASLPAHALRERIASLQARAPRRSAAAPPSSAESQAQQGAASESSRFVPSGVDAQVWLGFEQRIQERRFRALLEQAEAAVTKRDGIAARIALEEARELRPDAPELGELSARVLLLPMAMPAASGGRYGWSRAASGVALLVAGVALLMGLEWARPTAAPSPRPTPSVVVAPQHEAGQPISEPAISGPAPAAAPTPARQPETIEPEAPQPVPTVGIRRAVSIERPAQAGPATGTFRESSDIEPRLPRFNGEVPDDYVAPEYRNPRYQDTPATAPPASREPIAVVPGPTPTAASTPTAAPAPVALRPAAAAIVPVSTPLPSGRVDETRVTQVLNQYARAYGSLDASAAHAVWPSVDERALARAFASLQSQDVFFDNCNVNVRGATATASCRGRASYIGKIGNREPRTEQRQWTFELRRDGNDAWKIQNAEAQRLAYVAQ